MNNIESRVRELVALQVDLAIPDVKNEHKLVKDLGFDSIDEVECLIALEDKFNLRIEDEDARGLRTVQHLIDYVTKARQTV